MVEDYYIVEKIENINDQLVYTELGFVECCQDRDYINAKKYNFKHNYYKYIPVI